MSRLNKRELRDLANQYYYLEKQEEYRERFQGVKMTLQIMGQLTNVKNEIFRSRNNAYIQQIDTVEDLINKAYNEKRFNAELLEDYHYDVDYYGKLDSEEKRLLRANLEYLIERAELIKKKVA